MDSVNTTTSYQTTFGIQPPSSTKNESEKKAAEVAKSTLAQLIRKNANVAEIYGRISDETQKNYRACLTKIAEATSREEKSILYHEAIRRCLLYLGGDENDLQKIVTNRPNFINDVHASIMKEEDSLPASDRNQPLDAEIKVIGDRIDRVIKTIDHRDIIDKLETFKGHQDLTNAGSLNADPRRKFKEAQLAAKIRFSRKMADLQEQFTAKVMEHFTQESMLDCRAEIDQWLQSLEKTEASNQQKPENLTAKKKKKHKKKKPVETATVVHMPVPTAPTAPSQPEPPLPPPPSPEQQRNQQCRDWFGIPSPPVDLRVKRWRTTSWDTIRNFTDRDKDGNVVKWYAGKTRDELCWLKIIHDLAPTEQLINNPCYRCPNPAGPGCGLMARLEIGGAKPSTKYGMIYFGIDKDKGGLVYHRMFEERTKDESIAEILAGPKESVVYQPDLDTTKETSESEGKFEEVGAYQITVDKHAVIRIHYPQKNYTLFIYPSRTDLLPAGLFTPFNKKKTVKGERKTD